MNKKTISCMALAMMVSLATGCTDDVTTDLCPNDPNKDLPGICGCGVPDDEDKKDANKNGIIDCLEIDLCPDDPDKTSPKVCGCGVSDDDNNGNGIPDCLDRDIDLCPEDPNKTTGGICGCGVPDDVDPKTGIANCLSENIDFCPNDDNKKTLGICGCGNSDEPDPKTGIPKCLSEDIDLCPEDDKKTDPGKCGCGVPEVDLDGNGILDCLDALIDKCVDDPEKILPGACGCGYSDNDTDGDGVPDCLDACPRDKNLAHMSDVGKCDPNGTYGNGLKFKPGVLSIGKTSLGYSDIDKRESNKTDALKLYYIPAGNLVPDLWCGDKTCEGWTFSEEDQIISDSDIYHWNADALMSNEVSSADRGRCFAEEPLVCNVHNQGKTFTISFDSSVSLDKYKDVLANGKTPLRMGVVASSGGTSFDSLRMTINDETKYEMIYESKQLPVSLNSYFNNILFTNEVPTSAVFMYQSKAHAERDEIGAIMTGLQAFVGTPKVRFSNDGLDWKDGWEEANWEKSWNAVAKGSEITVYMQTYNPVLKQYDIVKDTIKYTGSDSGSQSGSGDSGSGDSGSGDSGSGEGTP